MHGGKVKSVGKKKANTSFILVIQSLSNLLRFPFLVKILYKQRATKDVPSLVFIITTKKLPASYTIFSDG